jgi:hypothetical protein
MRPAYLAWLKSMLALGITSFFDASGSIDDEPVGKGGIANPPPALTFARGARCMPKTGRPAAHYHVYRPPRRRAAEGFWPRHRLWR